MHKALELVLNRPDDDPLMMGVAGLNEGAESSCWAGILDCMKYVMSASMRVQSLYVPPLVLDPVRICLALRLSECAFVEGISP